MECVLTATNDSKTMHYCDLFTNVLEAHGGLECLTIRTFDGKVIELRTNPRSSFPPFDWGTTRCHAIQIAYFLSASNWNYLTEPFGFTYTGVQAREIEPWQEDGETGVASQSRLPKATPTTTPTSCCAAWTTRPT